MKLPHLFSSVLILALFSGCQAAPTPLSDLANTTPEPSGPTFTPVLPPLQPNDTATPTATPTLEPTATEIPVPPGLPEGTTLVQGEIDWEIVDEAGDVLFRMNEGEWIEVLPDGSEVIANLPLWARETETKKDGLLFARVVKVGNEIVVLDTNDTPVAKLKNGEWVDVKPLYYECGLPHQIRAPFEHGYKGVGGGYVPTGVQVELSKPFDSTIINVYICVEDIVRSGPNIPEDTFMVKALVWDKFGKKHRLPILVGPAGYSDKFPASMENMKKVAMGGVVTIQYMKCKKHMIC